MAMARKTTDRPNDLFLDMLFAPFAVRIGRHLSQIVTTGTLTRHESEKFQPERLGFRAGIVCWRNGQAIVKPISVVRRARVAQRLAVGPNLVSNAFLSAVS